ncbi:N-acetylmuramoyl-L-alanine amidase [Bacillus sp. ISL-75]|uniref:N-acetylmuramoyl-L-alanine amidase n=1 Tax=Bacillus sp. ISL-75 TaxID=2819137 RepID=UPI001BE6509C|nr:N-acetylmuramoyl-L-alanine amidase [Bacillus sp. ISL-75]MBT2728404.1 N-acetylmuramoyl-L-alanine amidase [Bacillus sp. ISL-75]
MIKIYLDGGHGGKDSGAAGNGLKEKDITLDICKMIEKGLNDYENIQVIQSRTTDIFVELTDRTKKANNANADVLLSIHCNSSTGATAKGFESHIYPNSGAATSAFQNIIHSEIMKALGKDVEDRGKKQSNFHMLREAKMKSILTENLFVSNAADAKLLDQEDFKQKIAQGHINGLEKFLGLKKSAQPPPESIPSGKLWIVQVGAFEQQKNAEALAADLKKQGYRPLIKYE